MAEKGEGQPDTGAGGLEAGEEDGTLESFVTTLQREGVEAGRREAERLKREAEERAEEVVERAEAEAERILADARSRAQSELLRGQTELRLAIRDGLLELQRALEGVLSAVLERAVSERLEDAEFVAGLIQDVVQEYARADAGGEELEVRVAPDLEERLRKRAVSEVAALLKSEEAEPLRKAGFEYSVGRGTVEMTQDAIVEKLHELVTPWLRDLVREAAEETGAVTAAGESGGEGS